MKGMQEYMTTRRFWMFLAILVLVRVFMMVVFPLTDTTEARYANMALIMAMSNDWITPYFDVGIPFWGKPPLSFWAAALSYEIFGVHDFVPRIPSLIATLLTAWLIFRYLVTFYAKATAYLGVLVYLSMVLVFVLGGAVLTDPFLVFASTLTMISFIMVIQKQESYWSHLFFIGIALGLLTKGPLIFVLVGGALSMWLMWDIKRLALLREFSWWAGIGIVLLLALPWYVLAELKTPGFIDYFIVGEHFMRFVDSGWKGDLYGTAHKEPKGFIWVMWLGAALPFSFMVLAILGKRMLRISGLKQMLETLREQQEINYFVMWSLFTMIFFTISANVLATYILPSLPALAILLAMYWAKQGNQIKIGTWPVTSVFVLFSPVVFLVAGIYFSQHEEKLPTEKNLIAYYQAHQEKTQGIYYVNTRPFSAQYYSANQAILVELSPRTMKHSQVITWQQFMHTVVDTIPTFYVVLAKGEQANIPKAMRENMGQVLFESKRYMLFKYQAP